MIPFLAYFYGVIKHSFFDTKNLKLSDALTHFGAIIS